MSMTNKMDIAAKNTAKVVDDCRWYSKQYKCTLRKALDEWEGEDQTGGFGLTVAEYERAEIALGLLGETK